MKTVGPPVNWGKRGRSMGPEAKALLQTMETGQPVTIKRGVRAGRSLWNKFRRLARTHGAELHVERPRSGEYRVKMTRIPETTTTL